MFSKAKILREYAANTHVDVGSSIGTLGLLEDVQHSIGTLNSMRTFNTPWDVGLHEDVGLLEDVGIPTGDQGTPNWGRKTPNWGSWTPRGRWRMITDEVKEKASCCRVPRKAGYLSRRKDVMPLGARSDSPRGRG